MESFNKVSEPWRIVAIVAMSLATLLLLAIDVFLALLPIFAPAFNWAKDVGFWIGMLIFFTVFTVLCAWILVRLLWRRNSRNGVTMMPTWFVQVIFFCAGISAIASAWMWNLPFAVIGGVGFLFGSFRVPQYLHWMAASQNGDVAESHVNLEDEASVEE